MSFSSHVLDSVSGTPAERMRLRLHRLAGEVYEEVASGVTDSDGRLKGWELREGRYRLEFATGEYWQAKGFNTFHPEVTVTFTVDDDAAHYHVPLLVSPFAYTTYRGS
ncbi:hydroxyisourate hydrolase [Haloglycomyces albus]|uniref:hydroxyisourate hydrolase n=1 Tax=Haloglycomyces albus TaxID=526067 RepID=UPI00046D2549|nr:hydroxyisourate hydrolase [Haloglycomyces albus]